MRVRAASAVLAVVLVASALPWSAEAQSTRKGSAAKTTPTKASEPGWRFSRRPEGPTLSYGKSAVEAQIAFSCNADTGLLRVVAQFGSRGVQPGDGVAIRLINGKNRFEFAGVAFADESREDVNVGGATRFDPTMLDLFKEGEALIVEVPGRKRSLPLNNASASADAFQKACSATAAAARTPAG